LNSHSNIAIPHPPHLINDFFKYQHLYGDLDDDGNFRQLVEDMVTHVRWHHHSWEIDFDSEAIFSKSKTRSILSIFEQIYDEYCRRKNKKRWGCKSLAVIHYVGPVREYFPGCKFIHLVRDCRDSAFSFKKVFFNRHNHVYFTADRWHQEQKIAWNLVDKRLPSAEILTVKYEDLLQDTESTVRKICVWIDEPFEQDMLTYFKKKEIGETAALSVLWENINAPIKRDNTQKYRKGLTFAEIGLIENIAGEELVRFGYSLDHPQSLSPDSRGQPSVSPFRLIGIYMSSYGSFLIKMISNLHRYREIYRRIRKRVIYGWIIFKRWLSHQQALSK